MDSALLDVPWFVTYAAEPFELLKIIHPHLVNATLPPPTNPIRLSLERRTTCDSGSNNSNSNNNSNNNNSTTTDKKSSNTGVLVGAVVGSIVGTLAIAIILFVVYKKRQRKKLEEKKTEGPTGAGTPFKDNSAMATPFVVPGMTHTPPPNNGGYGPGMASMNPEMNQFHNAMAAGYAQPTNPHFSYMPPPSVVSSTEPPSTYGGPGPETNYYNYAPPPAPQSPQPTINSTMTGTASTGISYYGSTPAPPFMNPHSTPSPPPPSGASSGAGMQWAPWAVPSTGGGAESSTASTFPSAAEEKAHYSGREWPDEKAQYRSNTMSGKVGEGSKAGGSTTNLVKEGEASVPVDPRDGARSPGVGITSDVGPRPGAMSPSPPAYSAQ